MRLRHKDVLELDTKDSPRFPDLDWPNFKMTGLLFSFFTLLFLYACAPAFSSDTPAIEPSADSATVRKVESEQNHTTVATDNAGPAETKTDMKSLQAAEMRMISGKEGLTIDTQTYDRTIEKEEILGEDRNSDGLNNVALAPIELDDVEIGQFDVTIETENSLTGGPQAGTFKSEIPSLSGGFTVGVIMPGSRQSLGSFGMGIQYDGGGSIVVNRN